jgi:hypothetical protein
MPTPAFSKIALATLLAATTLTGCSRGNGAKADSALDRDLNLVRPNDSTLMVVSPEERVRLDSARRAQLRATAASSPTPSRPAGRVARASSGEVATPAPTSSRIVKHTKRDAAIGAAAGAVIGGVTHGAKGAVVGGAAGGILGAVIGNNVDKKKKP